MGSVTEQFLQHGMYVIARFLKIKNHINKARSEKTKDHHTLWPAVNKVAQYPHGRPEKMPWPVH